MERLNKTLCKVFRLKESEINSSLTMDNIETWDSLTHMDLITSLEENFQIEFSMDEIMNMIDIKTMKDTIRKKLA